MKRSQLLLMLSAVLSLSMLAGCENLPGTHAQQGAVIGGASGAVAALALRTQANLTQ